MKNHLLSDTMSMNDHNVNEHQLRQRLLTEPHVRTYYF
jgi:hypothetical protein